MDKETDCRRLKVVQVTIEAHEGNGGIFTAVQHFARALRPWCDHSTVDFTERETIADGERMTVRISQGLLTRKFGWINRTERNRLCSALRGVDLAIIHVPYRFHAGLVANWCRKNNVPYLFVPHGAFDPYVFTYRAWQKHLWLAAIGRGVVSNATAVIFATRTEAEKASRAVTFRRSEILPWPTPVPPASDREQVRKNVLARFGLEPDTRLVVFLGRLHPMKRPAETAAAFRAVAPAGWTLIVAGPEEGVPRSAIASERRVIAPGGVFGTGKGELLAAADALVLFSHRENFGFAVTEALAQGTPVLISDELDLAPEIAATKSGWIADGRNHEGRMRGIVEVTGTMRSECVARGLRGRAWVADQLSEARFAENLRRIVENGMQGENRDIATHEQVGAVAERAS